MSIPSLVAIEGVIRHYAWGSRVAIARLLDIEPDGQPDAELWFGAHAGDPAGVAEHGTTLDALIAVDPVAALGRSNGRRFGPQLPFLLKVLAAERPLSIQVHPSLEQAQAGFDAEEAAGVARDAPERNYPDRNHKPELLCALTPFEALCGFRPIAETLELLNALAVPQLGFVPDLLRGPGGLRAAFTALLSHAEPAVLVDALTARIGARAQVGPLHAAALAAQDFPGDIGVVLAVLLNYVRLEPGEAIFVAAGNVHAYLRGTGVEIMASSDNVLRCGLTPKYVDVAELLKITDFSELAEPRCPAEVTGCVTRFPTPASDFELEIIDLDPLTGSYGLADGVPHIVLCLEKALELEAAGTRVALAPGHAAFVAAGSIGTTVHGGGRAFVASTPG